MNYRRSVACIRTAAAAVTWPERTVSLFVRPNFIVLLLRRGRGVKRRKPTRLHGIGVHVRTCTYRYTT